jgi:hypothetical protein
MWEADMTIRSNPMLQGQLGCERMEDSVFAQGSGPISLLDVFFSRKNPGGSNGFNFSGETYGISISRHFR